MKRTLTLAAAGLVAASLGGAASAKDVLKMATIAPGTSAYLTMTTMANVVNQQQDAYELQVDSTGAATKHIVEMAQGKLDMVMTSPAVYRFMKGGKAMYQKLKSAPELSKNVRLMFWFPYGTYHVTTYAEDGIETLQDIKGKKVFLGPPGGGAWRASADWILGTTGYKPGEDFDSVKASWSSALQSFQDRQIDVYIGGCIDPCPQFEQLSVTSKLRFLGVDKELADNPTDGIKKAIPPGRYIDVVKAGTYGDGQVNESDVYTLAAVVGVAVRKDLSDESVYAITKAFWEGLDKIRADAPWVDNITLDFAVQDGPLPLHPGALKYYEEVGLAIPDVNRP